MTDVMSPTCDQIGAFSVTEFCEAYGISRTHYYNRRKIPGEMPPCVKMGGRRVITYQSAAEWARRMEQEQE